VAGALRLADRITIRNDRSFVLHGRANDLIKVAGKRASLGALNAELTQIDGVLDGAFYMPGLVQTGGERLAAVAVAPGQTVSSILAELRKRIDPAFLPRPLRLVDALPRNEMGKLRRDSLRAFVSEHMQLDLQEGR
jgi:acyl-coenzyme A synthetase/AMP-(fatty) acid ligase